MIISTTLIGGYALGYAIMHSLAASYAAKEWARTIWGAAAERWYRLMYNVASSLLLLPFVPMLLWLPDRLLYTLPSPWIWLALLGQMAALVVTVYGIWLTDPWHFLGLRQLNSRPASPVPHHNKLVVTGLYRWVRHPLYLCGLILIWLTPQMTINRLVLAIIFSAYLYIGTFFEEQRLVREFGADYRTYQQQVPRLFPRLWSRQLLMRSGEQGARNGLSTQTQRRSEEAGSTDQEAV